MSRDAILAQLLAELFTGAELRALVERLPDGAAMGQWLPEGPLNRAEFAQQTAGVLGRYGRVPAAFEAARAMRWGQADRIAQAEADWRAAPAGTISAAPPQHGAPVISGGTFHGVNVITGGDQRGASITASAAPAPAPAPAPARAPTPAAAAPLTAWNPVRIVHISDLHFKAGTAWDHDPVLRRLAEDVGRVRGRVGALDRVVVTGDIAWSGKAAEYALAADWLRGPLAEAAGCPIRLVPGNHDVDRAGISRLARLAIEGLHRDPDPQPTAAELLGSEENRAPLLAAQAAFVTFAQQFHPGLKLPWWSERLSVRGVSVHLAGFNSAWMCLGDDDRGHLMLSRLMCNQLLEGAEQADLSVALTHHPFDHLLERDQGVCEEEIRRRAGVILQGHLHQQRARLAGDPDRDVLQLAAGASYSGSGWANAWQLLELDPMVGQARVHFRLWDGHDWIADKNRYQAAPEGVATLPLRRSPRAPRSPDPAPPGDPAPPATVLRATYAAALRARADVLARVFRVPDGPSALSRVYVELSLTGRADQLSCDPDAPYASVHRDLAALLGGPEGKFNSRQFKLEEIVALPHQRWVVLGDPGSGKTTLLRHAALTLLDRDGPLPVYLRVSELQADLRATLVATTGPAVAPFVLRAIEDGRAALFVDGLDEAPDMGAAHNAVRALCASALRCPVILASRPIGYEDPSPDFLRLAIAPLGEVEQRALLGAWVKDPAAVDRALDRLSRTPRLRRLAENPLLLTLAGLVLRQERDLPGRRAELYERAIHVLLHKTANPEKAARNLPSPSTALDLLALAALRLHGCEGEVYPTRSFIEALRFDPRSHAELRRIWGDEERFLAEVAEITGLVVPDQDGRGYTFPHRTFREFLAAMALERHMGEVAAGLSEATAQDGWWVRLLAWLEGIFSPRAALPAPSTQPPGELSRVLAEGRARPERWSEVLALTTGRLGPGMADALVRRVASDGGEALVLRVVADAEGLSEATIREVLKVEAGWDSHQARRKVLDEIPGLVGDLGVAVGLIEQFARTTTDGNDLFWAREVLHRVARGEVEGKVLDGTVEDARRAAAGAARGILGHLSKERRELARQLVRDTMKAISEGSFRMGSPEGEGQDDERPQHRVTFETGFQMMSVPVTWAMYRLFDPGHEAAKVDFKPYGAGIALTEQDALPVYNVTWHAAAMFAEWVGCRLPLEAEWEYACLAGSTTRYWSGDNEADLDRVGWTGDNSGGHPHPVGQKPANNWELADMHGNVWEWCLDPYDGQAYAKNLAGVSVKLADVSAFLAAHDAIRVVRGGGWYDISGWARSACRVVRSPWSRSDDIGFRLVLPAAPQGPLTLNRVPGLSPAQTTSPDLAEGETLPQ